MTLWDLRQTIESHIPWWTPFTIAGGILAVVALILIVVIGGGSHGTADRDE